MNCTIKRNAQKNSAFINADPKKELNFQNSKDLFEFFLKKHCVRFGKSPRNNKEKEEMYEYKSERVSPKEQNETVQRYAFHGWELMNAQETYYENERVVGVEQKAKVYNGDSFLGGFMQGYTGTDGNVKTTVKTVKDVTNYVTLNFRRDMNGKNYSKIVELEQECERLNREFDHNNVMLPDEPKKPIFWTVLSAIALVVLIVSLVMAFKNGETVDPGDYFVFVILFIIWIVTLVKWCVFSKKRKTYLIKTEEYQKIQPKLNKIAETIAQIEERIMHLATENNL